MYVICKNCGENIKVSHKPTGGTNIKGITASGNVRISGNKIEFGPGGKLSFGPSGSVGFGSAPKSRFTCTECGKSYDYSADDIIND